MIIYPRRPPTFRQSWPKSRFLDVDTYSAADGRWAGTPHISASYFMSDIFERLPCRLLPVLFRLKMLISLHGQCIFAPYLQQRASSYQLGAARRVRAQSNARNLKRAMISFAVSYFRLRRRHSDIITPTTSA